MQVRGDSHQIAVEEALAALLLEPIHDPLDIPRLWLPIHGLQQFDHLVTDLQHHLALGEHHRQRFLSSAKVGQIAERGRRDVVTVWGNPIPDRVFRHLPDHLDHPGNKRLDRARVVIECHQIPWRLAVMSSSVS
jgi:hypothetical protein